MTIGSQYIYRAGGTDVPVADGGTGLSTIGTNYILTGNGTSAMTAESGLTFDGTALTLTGNFSGSGGGYFLGNVGIGHSTPTVPLEIQSNGNAVRIKDSSNNSLIYMGGQSTDGFIKMYANTIKTVELLADGNSYFNSGNVGIGSTAPDEIFHVYDDTNPTAGSVIISGQRDGTANLLTLRAKDNSAPSSALPTNQGGAIWMEGFDGTD